MLTAEDQVSIQGKKKTRPVQTGFKIVVRTGTLFTKQLTQIPRFLRNFLTSVVCLYGGQIIVSVDLLKPLPMDFKCYNHKIGLNIC